MTEVRTLSDVEESQPASVRDAMRGGRQRAVTLLGQIERNQGMPTFTGRMSLEQFADLTVVHNRRWAEEAGESLDVVTQRDIIEGHANGLAMFMLQGLAAATSARLKEEGEASTGLIEELDGIQDRVGRSSHYGLPQVTLVMQGQPEVALIRDRDVTVAARLFLPSGRLFMVADGQHRRDAAKKVRDLLTEIVSSRRIPKSCKFYPAQDGAIPLPEMEAWIGIQETFRTWTMISYEAHLGLSVPQARQMFTNYNCHVKPVKADLNLEFDQSNPINRFAKEWVLDTLATVPGGRPALGLRELSVIHGFLFLGKTTIRNAPYTVTELFPIAKDFWNSIIQTTEWTTEKSLIREVPVLKALAKAWFYVFIARRNSRSDRAEALRSYIRRTKFDRQWMESVAGLKAHTVPAENVHGFRFSPAHNDIVARVAANALDEVAA